MPYPPKTSADDILRAAVDVVEHEGLAALSMRALAEKLGLRASSLYRHYADREALERALGGEAARRLHDAMRAAAAGAPRPAQAAARAFLAYAREHGELYGLLHAPRPPGVDGPGPGKDLWNFLLGLMEGVTGHRDDTAAAVALWAYLHGFAALERSGLLGLSGPRGGFERGLDALLNGLGGDLVG